MLATVPVPDRRPSPSADELAGLAANLERIGRRLGEVAERVHELAEGVARLERAEAAAAGVPRFSGAVGAP